MTDKHPHIERAIEIAGSQSELARRCSCAQQHISKLLNRESPVTAQMAVALSAATGGRIRVSDLIPEVAAVVAAEIARSIEIAHKPTPGTPSLAEAS